MLNRMITDLFNVKEKETQETDVQKVAEKVTQETDVQEIAEDVTSPTFEADFQKITAKQIATENCIGYISKAKGRKLQSNKKCVNKFYAAKGKYILLHPANDGYPTCPIEWYHNFDGEDKLIMDNHSSFKCITNLSDIILQMVRLYTKYIDDDMFIASDGFAIKLDDEVCPNYIGKASLVLTDDAIRNSKVNPEEVIEAKMYFLNDFLDCFIGWNFGVVIKNNPNLEEELLNLNNLVISKGLREDLGYGLKVFYSDDVQHYKFK